MFFLTILEIFILRIYKHYIKLIYELMNNILNTIEFNVTHLHLYIILFSLYFKIFLLEKYSFLIKISVHNKSES